MTRHGSDWLHMGLTVVDSLDTLLIMGLKDEYAQGRQWVADKLNFDGKPSVSVFETTIRILGGLLSAYYLSDGDVLFLQRAKQLGDR